MCCYPWYYRSCPYLLVFVEVLVTSLQDVELWVVQVGVAVFVGIPVMLPQEATAAIFNINIYIKHLHSFPSLNLLKMYYLCYQFTFRNNSLNSVLDVKIGTYRFGPRSEENSQWKMRMLRLSGFSEVIGVERNVSMMASLV